MPDSTSLANLKDLHLPQAIGWWPLATGWYVLIILILLLAIIAGWQVYLRCYKNKRYKREALRRLANYEKMYQQGGNAQAASINISMLLRQVALLYFPREHVASLTDEAWVSFLSTTSKNTDFKAIQTLILLLPYQKTADEADLKPLFDMAKIWIKQRGVLCLN